MSKDVISIFTDGSSHNNGEKKGIGGYGSVLIFGEIPDNDEDLRKEYGSPDKTLEIFKGMDGVTNQNMEIKAVTESLKRITDVKVPVYVFSDSAYVINCMNDKWYHKWLTNGWINSKKKPVENKEYWQELLQVINDNWFDITFVKVKGHDKIFYNELADKLAGKGTRQIEELRGF